MKFPIEVAVGELRLVLIRGPGERSFGSQNTLNWTLNSNSILHPCMRVGFSREEYFHEWGMLRLNEHQD